MGSPAAMGCYQWSSKRKARRRNRVYSILNRLGRERGRRTHERFEELAQFLKDHNLISRHKRAPWSVDRKRKIDHFVWKNNSQLCKIQLKSSEKMLEKFLENYNGHENIIGFAFNYAKPLEVLAVKFLRLIKEPTPQWLLEAAANYC